MWGYRVCLGGLLRHHRQTLLDSVIGTARGPVARLQSCYTDHRVSARASPSGRRQSMESRKRIFRTDIANGQLRFNVHQ